MIKVNGREHCSKYFVGNNFGEINQNNSIQSIARKLTKVTSCSLPKTLQASDAYKTGEKYCNTCSMNKEKYKSQLQIAKEIETIIDDVIEREEDENINEDNDLTDINKYSKSPKDKIIGKGNKISLKFSVYVKGDALKHNLKCVLIKLQRTIGDLIVQICFMKSRKLCYEERFKMFDVSTSGLKLLKYEFSNLTDTIVPLLKNSVNTLNNTQVCVTCVKEKLWNYNKRLENIIKSGRNVRLVMQKNDELNQVKSQCCIRESPHVHAVVQGKPIVLKYSVEPFRKLSKTQMSLQRARSKQGTFLDEVPVDFFDSDAYEPAGGDLLKPYTSRLKELKTHPYTKSVPSGDKTDKKNAQLASTSTSKVPHRISKTTVDLPTASSPKNGLKSLRKVNLIHKSPSVSSRVLPNTTLSVKKVQKSKATVATSTTTLSAKKIKKTRSLKMVTSGTSLLSKKEQGSKMQNVPFNTTLYSKKYNKIKRAPKVTSEKSFSSKRSRRTTTSDATINYPFTNKLTTGEISVSETSLITKRSQNSRVLETASATSFPFNKSQKYTARPVTSGGTLTSFNTLDTSKTERENSKTTLNSNTNIKSVSSSVVTHESRALFTTLEFRIKRSVK